MSQSDPFPWHCSSSFTRWVKEYEATLPKAALLLLLFSYNTKTRESKQKTW